MLVSIRSRRSRRVHARPSQETPSDGSEILICSRLVVTELLQRGEGVSRKGILMTMLQTRRRFMTTLSLAGTAGLLAPHRAVADDLGPETTTVRFAKTKFPAVCLAPQYAAEELLRAEGF